MTDTSTHRETRAAHAYTPGLRISERATVCRLRRLPLPGQVHVAVGDQVAATDIVASTQLPGRVHTLNIAHELNCQPDEIGRFMVKSEGEPVRHGDILAESKAFFGLFHSFVRAPIEGTIEAISTTTGQVLFRGEPLPVNLHAYVDGTVVEVHADEGVTIETTCALVQGIFGIGGERYGQLRVLTETPEQPLTADLIDASCRGAVLIGGGPVALDALQAAIEVGASAVVTGAIESPDLDSFIGHPIGVAITGQENIPISLIVTEGFGQLPMAERTFGIFRSLQGRRASVSGATQIRAGVIRPEVVVATEQPGEQSEAEAPTPYMTIGSPIRLIRAPYFGQLAEVVELPPEPVQLETEARVRVLRGRLSDGSVVTVPRANVEMIQR